jgi:hypothetical protein
VSIGAAAAQTGPLVARASDVTGRVLVSNGNGLSALALTRGYTLNMGDQVDTRGGGRLVIDLSDGSLVVVHPETLLIIKDYRAAASLRELFDITVGMVRVKINHFAGKPNPYRMNSPTASVAVRGTEFTVAVDTAGDTQVEVFEGAVEVRSLTQPDMGALIEAGRGVLVRPGQPFQIYSGPIGRLLAFRLDAGDRDRQAQAQRTDGRPADARGDTRVFVVTRPGGPEQPGQAAAPPPLPGTAGATAPSTQIAAGWNALPGAPPDPRSPWPREAGATGRIETKSKDYEGDDRFLVASSGSLAGTYERYLANLAELNQTPFLYRFTTWADPHLDSLENPAYATSIRQAQGRLTVMPSLSGLSPAAQEFGALAPGASRPAEYGVTPQVSFFTPVAGTRLVIGGSASFSQVGTDLAYATSTSHFLSNSFVAASRWGRHSVGLSFDRLQGDGTTTEFLSTDSTILQRRVTAGYSLDFGRSQKLGAWVRYGGVEGSEQNRLPFLKTGTSSAGHSTEVGVRLRGHLAPRLFYGVTAQWMGLSLGDTDLAGFGIRSQRDRLHRETLGLGLGYVLTRRTVLTMDLAGGLSRLDSTTGFGTGRSDSRFASVHTALQRDITRRLFASASYLHAFRTRESDPLFSSTGLYNLVTGPYQAGRRFSDFGAGWRFTPNLTAQYIFSTSYGASQSAHGILVRYTFRLPER